MGKMRKFIFPALLLSLLLSGCNAVETYNENDSVSTEIKAEESVDLSQTVFSEENVTNSESNVITSEETENNQNVTTEILTEKTENVENAEQTVGITTQITENTQSSSENEVAQTTVLKAENIFIKDDTLTVKVGYTTQIKMEIMPVGSVAELQWSSTDITIASVDQNGTITGVSEGACTIMLKDKNNPELSKSVHIIVEPEVIVTKSYSINGVTNLTYISGVLVANKTYALPSDYDPGVDPEAMEAFNEMQKAAELEGCNLYIASGYRSYETQKNLYERYVERDGQQMADTYSARPGHSEHQTGLAFDLNSIDASFANTPEGKWIAENCYKYGFIIRYPANKSAITGYTYEPWHIRYLGVNLATAVHQSGLCLEEYLGITSFYEDDTQY